jgi:hypothetical protein
MPFPKARLAAAHRLLRQGGILFLSMPNMEKHGLAAAARQ